MMNTIIDNTISSGDNELYDKMRSVLRQRGFYAEDNKDYDPCHFLTEQEQTAFKSAIEYFNSIPF